MATTTPSPSPQPMTSAAKDAAARALCVRRGQNPDDMVDVHGAHFFLWQTVRQEIQNHIDLVYVVEGRQL